MTDSATEPAGAPALVLPRGTDPIALALRAFPTARWLISPEQAAEASRPRSIGGGARFRGLVAPTATVWPRFQLASGVEIEGPQPPTPAVAAALGRDADSMDMLVLPALPQAMAWARSAVTAVGGAVITTDGQPLKAADESDARAVASRGFYLYSPSLVAPDAFLLLVRPALPMIREAALDPADHDARGHFVAPLDPDGTVDVLMTRAGRDLPVGLTELDWRDYGPHVYALVWMPPDDAITGGFGPGGAWALSVGRALPTLARTARYLRSKLEGAVVNQAGALVSDEALGKLVVGR